MIQIREVDHAVTVDVVTESNVSALDLRVMTVADTKVESITKDLVQEITRKEILKRITRKKLVFFSIILRNHMVQEQTCQRWYLKKSNKK